MQCRAVVCVLGSAVFSVAAACRGDVSSGGSGGSGGGASATGGTSGTGGASGATGGATGGSSGTGGVDASVIPPTTDASSGDGSPTAGMRRHGNSAGCGKPAAMAGGQTLAIPKCMGCSAAMGNCPRDCIAPEFAPRAGGNIDFTTPSFSIGLPAGYDPNMAYPIFMGGGGCGSGGGGLGLPGATGIRVSLAIKNRGALDGACFAHRGQACSGNTTTLSYCVNSPEMAYVRGILSYIETHYCVDLDKEFIGGASSGAWEAYTLGCGDADQLRGFVAIAGGNRQHRCPCPSPPAPFLHSPPAHSH